MSSYVPTPHIAHLTAEDYEHVYEPAEDSFILLDALEQDAAQLRSISPILSIEIGSGSGIVSVFLANLLGPTETMVISTDINHHACSATLRTGQANKIPVNPVLTDLLGPLSRRVRGAVDLLVINPPYVPTSKQELFSSQAARNVGGAWAGGDAGMELTQRVLEQVPTLLSHKGSFYLVAIEQNHPYEIVSRMQKLGLIVLQRRAGRERLFVIRMTR
ncbi:MAG: S-adenosylmethionine-dependent methyltransferase [Tremellales sp. Tagirdzhanova-0007]|nr:MAG: S-adenosylmethionine-dependent methyltransferase [Tremellales sp. Tagirdzhanova-0007]